jgi:hypothetical protein
VIILAKLRRGEYSTRLPRFPLAIEHFIELPKHASLLNRPIMRDAIVQRNGVIRPTIGQHWILDSS